MTDQVRVFGYAMARELTAEELGKVAGGWGDDLDFDSNPGSEYGGGDSGGGGGGGKVKHVDTYCVLDPDSGQAQLDDCTGC